LAINFALIGCGNIGSRHLQALAKLPYDINVEIVEPSKTSITLGKSRLREISSKKSQKFHWHGSLKELKNSSNLTIIATNSKDRVNQIMELLKMGHSNFLVEKVVCQSTKEYNFLLSQFKKFKAKGWVNTNRRYFQAWKKIKESLKKSGTINFSVVAPKPELGTNLIHYVDLFSWLTNDKYVKLNGDNLIKKIYPNKRGKGFKEFAGTIKGKAKNGSVLSVTFIPSMDIPSIVTISTKNTCFIIDEVNDLGFFLSNKLESHFPYKFEHASDLTTKIVLDIIKKKTCKLPTLEYSYNSHKEVFRIFNKHIQKISNKKMKLCPIT
jgi:hypothetical protein